LDDIVYDMVIKFAKEIEFMQSKLIGLIEGNHYWQFANGTTSTQKLCEQRHELCRARTPRLRDSSGGASRNRHRRLIDVLHTSALLLLR
jgi:hypothetical protein